MPSGWLNELCLTIKLAKNIKNIGDLIHTTAIYTMLIMLPHYTGCIKKLNKFEIALNVAKRLKV